MGIPGSGNIGGRNNRYYTSHNIANKSLSLLKNNLIAIQLINNDYKNEFAEHVGEVISIRKPNRFKSEEGRVMVKQPIVDEYIPLTINRHRHVGYSYDLRDKTLSFDNWADRVIKPAMCNLADEIDKSIITKFQQGSYSWNATGNSITVDDIRDARAYQNKLGVPTNKRFSLLEEFESSALNAELSGIYNESIVKSTISDHYRGKYSGYDAFTSVHVPNHTVGNYSGTPLVNGANQNGSVLVTDGWTSGVTGLLKKGDVIQIAGIYSVNPQSYVSTGQLMHFVVTADVNSDGPGNAQIPISPSINDSTVTTIDGEGGSLSKTAYQNIIPEISNNAPIAVLGTANKTYRQNYLFHRDAVAFVMVQIAKSEEGGTSTRAYDPDTGLSVLYSTNNDIIQLADIRRLDAMWGVDVIYPELIMRVWGKEL